MQTVMPFRAWRYDPDRAGGLERLVAPPYDVIAPGLQSRLYARSRYNVVRIDLGMTTPSDSDCDNPYTRAASQLIEWKADGILVRDSEPCLTFVEEAFVGPDGRARTRRGFLGLVRLSEFGAGTVYPHEQTLSGPKEDRFRLMLTTRMSLSPVFLLYELPGDEITAAWQAAGGATDPHAVLVDPEGGHDATITRLWRTADPLLLELVSRLLADRAFIIADGHHRYETALHYRDHQRKTDMERTATPDCAETAEPRAYDYALAYFSNTADPGLAIYGTHRLVRGLDAELLAALPRDLSPIFAVERLTSEGQTSKETASEAITAYLEANPKGAFGLWGPALDGAYGLRLADPSAARRANPGHSTAYQALDVAVLQSLILEDRLGITPADMAADRHVKFFKDPFEAFQRLEAGEFQAGFFVSPTGLDQVQEVALSGERMPQKATFFYPKLPTGLVFHDLSGTV